MDSLSITEALLATQTTGITPSMVAALITEGDTTAEIVTSSKVKTAAAHKNISIYKVSKSSVILPVSGQTYVNMVKESAARLGSKDEDIESYTTSDTYYQHTDVYPVCESKKDAEKKYLYCIYEDTTSPIYIMNGAEVTKEEVAVYLTAGEAKKLLGSKPTVTENVSHGLTHDVTVRTVSLGNVISIRKALTPVES